MLKKLLCYFLSLFILAIPSAIAATNTSNQSQLPWSFLVYYGVMTQSILERSFSSGFTSARLYSVEPALELAVPNALEEFFAWELAANLTFQTEPQGNIFELNPMIMFRWKYFPWNQFIITSIALGEGISYATNIPTVERRVINKNWGEPKNLVNFLALEITFSLPKYKQWELVGRIHHRSAAWGLYNAGNASSNALALGVRYHF